MSTDQTTNFHRLAEQETKKTGIYGPVTEKTETKDKKRCAQFGKNLSKLNEARKKAEEARQTER